MAIKRLAVGFQTRLLTVVCIAMWPVVEMPAQSVRYNSNNADKQVRKSSTPAKPSITKSVENAAEDVYNFFSNALRSKESIEKEKEMYASMSKGYMFEDEKSKQFKMAKKLLRYIAEEKYAQARKFMDADIHDLSAKLKEKFPNMGCSLEETMYPAFDLADAILSYKKDYADKDKILSYNPNKGYAVFSGIMRSGLKVPELRSLLDNPENKLQGLSLEKTQKELEQILFEQSRKHDTEEKYDSLLTALLANSSFREEVIKLRHNAAYRETMNAAKVEKCIRFLAKYTQSPYIQAVTNLRDSLLIERLPATVEACEEFMRSYPGSIYIGKVKMMREDYAFKNINEHTSLDKIMEFLRGSITNEHRLAVTDILYKKYSKESIGYDELMEYKNTLGNRADPRILKLLASLTSQRMFFRNMGYMRQVSYVRMSIGETHTYYKFNRQGLLSEKEDFKNGITEIYNYYFSPQDGWTLVSIEYSGKKSMTEKFVYTAGKLKSTESTDGSHKEYTESNGMIYEKVYARNGSAVCTNVYTDTWQLCRVEMPNDTYTLYEYDGRGAILTVVKKRSGTVMDTATFEYADNYDGDWTVQDQYNAGTHVLTRRRDINYWNR